MTHFTFLHVQGSSTLVRSLVLLLNWLCLDNLYVCGNVHTDYDSALVAVCTASCALQIVLFTLHYI